ncbi:MAG: NUDIX domain-containing protein [Rhizobiales bacterium]|nr:NUDIX domain-containing protein [Hyphomicrobiales bacterium]
MNVGIFIGRFQPLHIGHLTIMSYMQQKYEHVIILVGSANQRISVKNPFSFSKRKAWIEQAFANMTKENGAAPKLSILPSNDYRYAEKKWEIELNQKVSAVTSQNDLISLVGYSKDDSSYYLNSFSQWAYDAVGRSVLIDATTIRNVWFDTEFKDLSTVERYLPQYVYNDLLSLTNQYENLLEEKQYFEQETMLFEHHPYPETLKLCTADCVLICNAHVLLIKRAAAPGKNCWALPGGFVNQNESFATAAVRELIEETQIILPSTFNLHDNIKSAHLFDDPKRCFGISRISVGHLIEVPLIDGAYPKTNASDDAVAAKWTKLSQIKNITMFDDHADIIDYFLDIL